MLDYEQVVEFKDAKVYWNGSHCPVHWRGRWWDNCESFLYRKTCSFVDELIALPAAERKQYEIKNK